MGTEGQLRPGSLADWRATDLGAITERLETAVIFDLAGEIEGKLLLDVGTGDGAYSLEAARRGARVTALDRSPEMIEAAQTRALSSEPAITTLLGDAEALPFADETFDVVMAITTLCFVANQELAIREMVRVLRGGGRIVVGELGPWNLWAVCRRMKGWLGSALWRQAHFQTLQGLRRRLASAGVCTEVERSAIFYSPWGPAARLLGPLDAKLEPWLRPFGAFVAIGGSKSTYVSQKGG